MSFASPGRLSSDLASSKGAFTWLKTSVTIRSICSLRRTA
eukprot:CAMPEP_0181529256 /NCGR_PEP_ID=MMETSP1110-20121109/70961_1 /TAXON_ID=174948 /ORGANISM="Symbiodinium sp., Strain CCMP421" /LENGTH=39 /DNA_ID= /DNA_START= /DNA_END= /DNA_ORIENTATION=